MPLRVTRTSVHCAKDSHDYYRELTGGPRSEALYTPFATMVQAFVAFACLGRKIDRYIPIARENRQEIFIAPSLDQKLHLPVLAALAFDRLQQQDMDVDEALGTISTTDGLIPIVEGWAEGGLQEFRTHLQAGGPHNTETLFELLYEDVRRVL